MVDNLSEWPWSSWRFVMGETQAPAWLAIDTMLLQFSKYKTIARRKFAQFVEQGKGVNPWKNISNQVFLGSDDFIKEHLELVKLHEGDVSEVPKKQRRARALPLDHYEKQNNNRDEAIKAAYATGGYALKEIGDYFQLHYFRVSKIVSKRKTCPYLLIHKGVTLNVDGNIRYPDLTILDKEYNLLGFAEVKAGNARLIKRQIIRDRVIQTKGATIVTTPAPSILPTGRIGPTNVDLFRVRYPN